jgi:hypothetical protein
MQKVFNLMSENNFFLKLLQFFEESLQKFKIVSKNQKLKNSIGSCKFGFKCLLGHKKQPQIKNFKILKFDSKNLNATF